MKSKESRDESSAIGIDIDSNLMTLVHGQVIETTKQQMIMNIDSPLSDSDLDNKLRKINKLVS